MHQRSDGDAMQMYIAFLEHLTPTIHTMSMRRDSHLSNPVDDADCYLYSNFFFLRKAFTCFDVRICELYKEHNKPGKNELIHVMHMIVTQSGCYIKTAVGFYMPNCQVRRDCFDVHTHWMYKDHKYHGKNEIELAIYNRAIYNKVFVSLSNTFLWIFWYKFWSQISTIIFVVSLVYCPIIMTSWISIF